MTELDFPLETFPGVYRGLVVDNRDPEKLGRLKVVVPTLLGNEVLGWAQPCLPVQHSSGSVPKRKEPVWIIFVGGDLSQPVWMGTWATRRLVEEAGEAPPHNHDDLYAPVSTVSFPGYSSGFPENTASAGGAVGVSGLVSRADHRHGFATATPLNSLPGDTAAQGSAPSIARSDHRHGREAVLDTSWQSVTYQNNWVAYGDPFPPARWKFIASGVVLLDGMVRNGTSATIFTLPTGARPSHESIFTVTSNGVSARVDVRPTGTVAWISSSGGSNAYVSLVGIVFAVA